jgi:SAM-dependent methyltransferase
MTATGTVNTAGQSIDSETPVIDYEGSGYRADFWTGRGRDYEDATERLALQRLLPARGPRIAELGAGFGRLADLYLGYEQIILFDYSRTLLQDAVKQWGHDPRFVFVAGNLYELPLATGVLDTLVMVRVMHHLADVRRALQQIHRVMHGQSVGVLEYANKRNLKAIVRWALGQQTWSPFQPTPIEFVRLNYDFHPAWMYAQLLAVRLNIQKQLAVSHFRLPGLKQHLPAAWLAKADSLLFTAGGIAPLSPSVFVQVEAEAVTKRSSVSTEPGAVAGLFRCPACSAEQMEMVASGQLCCQNCGIKYSQKSGIWDFKEADA